MRPANVYSPISQVRSGIAGKVVGRAFHYFVWSDDPARSLRDEMLGILSIVGFWTRDGPTVVRLLDDHGRSVWAAGIDDGKTWARVTPRLAGCGPVRFWDGRKVRALGRFDTSERCPAVSRARMTAMAGKVLR